MSWGQIDVGILHNLRLEALRVTKLDLRLAGAGLDGQATALVRSRLPKNTGCTPEPRTLASPFGMG